LNGNKTEWERAAERGVRTVENPNLRSILFYGNARGNDASNKCYKIEHLNNISE